MKPLNPPKTRPNVIGTGLFALDLVLDDQGALMTYGLGGSAGNVLSILAKFNWNAVPVTEIGNDVAGAILLEEFNHLKANTSFIWSSEHSHTPVVYQHQLIDHSLKTHEFSFSCPICGEKRSMNKNSISIHDTTVADKILPKVLYLDRPTLLGVELAEYYKSTQSVLIVFEPSQVGRDPELFQRALNAADIVKYADDRMGDLEAFQTHNVSVEICTMGSQGLRYRAPSLGNEWVVLDSFKAPKVVDTAGAGDWCTAGMIQHLIEEEKGVKIHAIKYNQLYKALRFGQALSALNCMTVGAQGLMRVLPLTDIKAQAKRLMASRLVSDIKQPSTSRAAVQHSEIAELLPKKLRSQPNLSVSGDICCSALA